MGGDVVDEFPIREQSCVDWYWDKTLNEGSIANGKEDVVEEGSQDGESAESERAALKGSWIGMDISMKKYWRNL